MIVPRCPGRHGTHWDTPAAELLPRPIPVGSSDVLHHRLQVVTLRKHRNVSPRSDEQVSIAAHGSTGKVSAWRTAHRRMVCGLLIKRYLYIRQHADTPKDAWQKCKKVENLGQVALFWGNGGPERTLIIFSLFDFEAKGCTLPCHIFAGLICSLFITRVPIYVVNPRINPRTGGGG